MADRFLFGKQRDIVWSEDRDSGGMFDATVGVFREDGKFHAFVKDGWGGGCASKPHPDLAAAMYDIDRVWGKYYGE